MYRRAPEGSRFRGARTGKRQGKDPLQRLAGPGPTCCRHSSFHPCHQPEHRIVGIVSPWKDEEDHDRGIVRVAVFLVNSPEVAFQRIRHELFADDIEHPPALLFPSAKGKGAPCTFLCSWASSWSRPRASSRILLSAGTNPRPTSRLHHRIPSCQTSTRKLMERVSFEAP